MVAEASSMVAELLTMWPFAVLKKGGNAVDSAIASALCIGVIDSFATGIGGYVYRPT